MENSVKNTIIDVIPLTRLPLNRQQSFSYLHSEKVPFGSLVSIPLFHRSVNGIAIDNRNDFFRFGNIRLKKINGILDENFLTEKQLQLAKFISEYYLCPLGIVLKFFVIKKTKSRSKKQESEIKDQKEIALSKQQRIIFNKISKNKKNLLIAGAGKIEIYLELINKTLQSEKQSLILVPELSLVYQMRDYIGDYFNLKEIALFHSQMTEGQLYENYEKIKSGSAKIIIGTRQAIFSPFKDLGTIIIDEEQDISYKQWDMNPRYNARDVAYKLAEIYGAKLLLSSVTPSLESYSRIKEKINIPNTKYETQNIEIVDLRKEGWSRDGKKKKDVLISKKLESEIGWTIKNGKQAILFINRRGMSSFSVCNDCGETFRCPRCERALIYDKKGIYRCFHCSYKTSIFPECPKCHSSSFRNIGTGNQTIEREIKKIFPEARTKLIDFESLQKKEDKEKMFQDLEQNKFNIIIGTQSALKSQNLPYLHLIGIINADTALNSSDFNSDERAFQIFFGAAEKIQNLNYGKLILQTYNPQHPVIKALDENLEKFYNNELDQRQILKYPPYYKLIKLILRTENKPGIEKEAGIIFERVKHFSKENDVSVFEPFTPLLSKVRDKFRKQIVIKIKGQEIPKDLEKCLKGLGSNWITDVDPINLV